MYVVYMFEKLLCIESFNNYVLVNILIAHKSLFSDVLENIPLCFY